MDKQRIEQLANKFRKKAENAYNNYQETGISRYAREYRNAEDIADALQVALNASDEHTAFINLRADIGRLAARADNVRRNVGVTPQAQEQRTEQMLNEVVSLAEAYHLYRRP